MQAQLRLHLLLAIVSDACLFSLIDIVVENMLRRAEKMLGWTVLTCCMGVFANVVAPLANSLSPCPLILLSLSHWV